MQEDTPLLPELQELLDASFSKHRKVRGKKPALSVDNRAAAFVNLHPSTQQAIANLVWACAKLPNVVVVRELERQLRESMKAIERLRETPALLEEENARLEMKSSKNAKRLIEMEALLGTLNNEVSVLRKEVQSWREKDESRRTKARQKDRGQIEAGAPISTLEDCYEQVLKAVHLYSETILEVKTNTLDRKRVAQQIAAVRKKLTIIEREANLRV